ncbi:thiamine pyrophosphate-binding protein [Salinispora arenicola]|uniref:thiamine pyrophosphate-binding protein n=1 Tax=Salinispora arenicola TaxID=168697 RepID=UPI00035DA6A9|nr:thiamine pyrophosphate-binding protein [Salinispora arenicola]MCN0154283.1 thiamine pyrophosphate-binding protein [Salinispora arenicola]
MGTTESSPPQVAQRVVEVLQAYGVQYIFGVPGAKVDAMYDALADGGPRLIVCRHEQNAAFMAAAVGRLTGIPGAVLVTSGPGTANLVTRLLTASTEQDPVIALCGAASRANRLKRAQQSFHAAALLATVTRYTGEVSDPDNVCEALSKAIRTATTEPRGAAAVVLPQDVLAASTAQTLHRPAPVPRLNAAPPEAIAEATT